ncbi:F0F1 ATP synthase subunit delta [Fictibacillus sp. Mic-4]|uniref:F0F1 ATP synthase subunit delta n=1 Tax=Fictibacillus TaxID=1329200 RepID=UPI0004099463|nr:F0F1 ATP synthase subunit delta [Fictibacillus gelatini]
MSKDQSVIAKRYALALFEVVRANNLEQVEDELRLIKEVFRSNKDLLKILNHPKISTADKKELVKTTFGAALSAPVMNTIFLLIDRNRHNMITEMVSHFIVLANEAENIAEAKVYSVRPLTEKEKEELEATFAARVGKAKLRIENIVDPSLIGGIKVRIGNRIFDGSISGKLERIERQLA